MSADAITDFVARHYGVSADDLRSYHRYEHLITPRRVCWIMLHKKGWSYSRIGRAFNRHHSTVMHGIKMHRERQAQ